MWRRRVLLFLAGALAVTGPVTLAAQTSEPGNPGQDAPPAQADGRNGAHRGQYAGMGHVAGEVTAVAGATLTVRTEEGGTAQIVTTDNTRVMKARGPVRVSDLHPGDGLMAMGNLDPATHTLHAAVVMAEDAAEVKAMKENLGKTYITGRVTAINLDDAKMTVERPDHVAQTIGFDESTSFKRALRPQRTGDAAGGNGPGGGNGGGGGGFGGGFAAMTAGGEQAFTNGESITLADIKVGDRVAGTGAVKGGTFVPVHLLDSPGGGRRPHGDTGAPGAPAGSSQAASGAGSGPGAR